MRILITGGAGYLGSSLVNFLNDNDHVNEIIIYDNLSANNYNIFFGNKKLNKLRFIKGDILDSYNLVKAIKEVDTLIHLAAFVSYPYNHLQNLQYEQINCWGSLNVVNAVKNESTVKKVIYLSSAAVYGFRENILFEDTPSPGNAYSDSKLKGEQYFNLLENTHDLNIIRSANVFGYTNSMRLDNVINSFLFDVITKRNVNIYGDGNQKRPFIDINNITKIISDSIFNENAPKLINAIEFNASINQIKDIILNIHDSLEYSYINQNQIFPSQSFKGYDIDIVDQFHQYYNTFRKHMSLV